MRGRAVRTHTIGVCDSRDALSAAVRPYRVTADPYAYKKGHSFYYITTQYMPLSIYINAPEGCRHSTRKWGRPTHTRGTILL